MTATAEVETKTTEELVAEHERMIIDLQLTIADIAQGRIVVTHESVESELYAQSQRIAELQQSVEDLMAGGVATKTGHTVRARVAHDFTVKEGHRLKETTVEFTSGSDGAIDWDRIDAEMMNAYVRGLIQANYRNSSPNPALTAPSDPS